MADFRPIQGTKARFDSAQRIFTLAPGSETDIALWGGGPNGEDLTVISTNKTLFEAYDLRYVSNPLGPHLARIRIKILGRTGRGLIEARLGGPTGPAWAAAWITIGSNEDSYTGTEHAVNLPSGLPDPDAVFHVRVAHIRQPSKPIYDQASRAVIGYVYSSAGYFEYYDLFGNRVATDEIGLDQPLFDPIDLLFLGGSIIRGVGKAAVKAGVRAVASAGTRLTIRALTTAVIELMRTSLRRVVSGQALKFTATTAARMASKDRHVPVHILQLAIRFGKREADPQKIAGLFRYTIKMFRNGTEYTLEVVVRESDRTIMHFLYK